MKDKFTRYSQAPLSRKLGYMSYAFSLVKMKLLYKWRFKSLGKGSVIRRPLFLTPEYISLGDRVSLGHDARLEAIHTFGNDSFTPEIIIGDNVSFQQRCHITAAGKLQVGANTMASFDVMITDIDHGYQEIGLPISRQSLEVKMTSIGENCFLGAGVKIQAGTILGTQCIVGANAVVRGTFPDFCVIAGVPARIIKKYDRNTKKWERVKDET